MRVLITGCGRSGTRYTAKVLNKLDIAVGHEKDGPDGRVSWIPVGVPVFDFSAYEHVFHQVRHPLETIASFTTAGADSWNLIHDCTGLDLALPVVLRSAMYWVSWNLLVEQIAEWRYRIEDFPSILPGLLERLDGPLPPPALSWQDVSTDNNWREHGDVFWDDIEKLSPVVLRNVKRLARRYGYDTR